MALKEEKVLVTSVKIKGSVRKETNAVSGMRVTIVHVSSDTVSLLNFQFMRCYFIGERTQSHYLRLPSRRAGIEAA